MLDVITELVIQHGGVELSTKPQDVVDVMADGFMGLEGSVTELKGINGREGCTIPVLKEGRGLSPGCGGGGLEAILLMNQMAAESWSWRKRR